MGEPRAPGNPTVSAIQFKPAHGNPEANRKRMGELVTQAADKGARVITLPEMAVPGYLWPDPDALTRVAEEADGASFGYFSELARTHEAFIAYGFPERDGTALFNSQNLIGPDGRLLATYRKVHLFEADAYWARSGDRGFMSLETDAGRLGLGICMDLNYDDFMDFHITMGTDILCFSTCWLEQGIDVRAYWLERFGAFSGTALMANSYDGEFGIPYCGRSSIYRDGVWLAQAGERGDEVLVAVI